MYRNLTFLRRASLFVTGGASLAYLVTRSIVESNVEKYKLKMGGEEFAVPEKVQNLIEEVIKDVTLSEGIRVTSYITKSTDLKVCFSFFATDILLGIPQHFIYDADNDTNFIALVDGQEIPRDVPEFQSLKHSMCLSNEAKKFAIAYKLYEAQHSNILPYGILPLAVILHCNFINYCCQKMYPSSKKLLAVRNHFLMYLFAPILYLAVHDSINVFKEFNSNSMTAYLGKSYIQGGIEYYKKVIQKNKILRVLNKSAPYTEDGDITTSFWRTNHFSLHQRITNLEGTNEGKVENIWNYLF